MRKNQVIHRAGGYFGVAWLLLPVTLLAQGAPGSIQGIVCEIKTCKPIDGAQVSVVHPGGEVPVKTMRTGGSGEFGFFDLEPGNYIVRARADDFINRAGGPSAIITNGDRIENIKVELTALGTISGAAFDENGEPVVGARVEALAGVMNSPFLILDRMVAIPQASATTDRQGAFRISRLDAYEYYVRVVPPNDRANGKSYPTTYYPATANPENAVKIFAAPGTKTEGINIRLIPGSITLRGRFVSPSDAPARAVPVLIARSPAVLVAPALQARNLASLNSTETETPFEIRGVPPGSYYLYGVTSDGKSGVQWVRTAIEVGSEDVNDITIVLSAPGTIKGRVRTASDATDADKLDFSRLTFGVTFAELTMPLVASAPPAHLNKNGEFQFERLPEANGFLRPSYLDDGWFISDMQLDGQDVMGSGFSSKPAQESVLEVTISNAGGGITGIIKDRQDKPLGTGRLVLLPEPRLRANPFLLKTGVANVNGEFTIDAIRPGNYTLLGFPNEDEFTPAFLRNRDLLERYEAFGNPISVGAGQTIRADVTVVPQTIR
jgi:Carboxypeptidase regulatory-like domain